jgi:phospholipid/cholesterol/gamma-HCH transport system substrate-binding protein
LESKVNYTLVGFFVVLFTFGVIATGYWFSTAHNTDDYETYLSFMNEAVSGLTEQAPVTYNGVAVGFVEHISLNPNNLKQVRLQLRIKRATPVTVSTVATLLSRGITGVTYIGLSTKTASAPKLKAKRGEPYPVIAAEPSLLVELDNVVRQVTASMKEVSDSVGKLLDDKNQQSIRETLDSLAIVSKTFAKQNQSLDESIRYTNKILHNTALASEKFPTVIKSFNKMTDEVTQIAQTGKQAMHRVDEQILPSASDVLARLDYLSQKLDRVATQIEQNPSILVRGREPEPKGPGE